jgi:enterochelin esterase-like enzyme
MVYLPPAWFRSKNRPSLATMEMIGGEFTTPTNWIRVGNAVQTADDYAAKHGGFAPVMVFVDATGDFKTDTECVNGPAGKAQDHLVKDVPPFVEKTFNTSTDQKKWAVVGWSMGGTCAVTLVTAHNDLFKHFLDISGDIGPNMGNKQQTIDKLYGGDAAAYDANDPLTVMAHHGPYRNTTGLFAVGDAEGPYRKKVEQQLVDAGAKVGIVSQVTVTSGKHDWQFAVNAFADQLPWLAEQLNPSEPQPQPDPKASGTAH